VSTRFTIKIHDQYFPRVTLLKGGTRYSHGILVPRKRYFIGFSESIISRISLDVLAEESGEKLLAGNICWLRQFIVNIWHQSAQIVIFTTHLECVSVEIVVRGCQKP
jgi:hypothetical protein